MTWLKNYTIPVALACQASGVLIMSLTDNIYIIFACSAIAGLGYGVMQPMMYDKASMTATGNRVFMALAWAMAGNYLAILVSPFLNEAIKMFFDSKSMYFTFRFNSFLIFIVFFLALIKRNSFLFGAKISNDVEQKD